MPGLEVKGVAQGGQQQVEAFILHPLARGQDVADPLPVMEVGLGHLTREEMHLRSAVEMALVPAMMPHGLGNMGDERVRGVGFFSSNVIVSTFDQLMMPFNQRVVGTPPILEDEQVATGDAGVSEQMVRA